MKYNIPIVNLYERGFSYFVLQPFPFIWNPPLKMQYEAYKKKIRLTGS